MSKTSTEQTREPEPFITRTGVRIPLGQPVRADQINLDDIVSSLASLATFDGHTVIPWSLAARALNFLNTARMRSADEQLNRDELLSLALRDAFKCYRYDYAPANVCIGETRTAIAKALGFAWTHSPVMDSIIADTIRSETDQLLKTKPGTAPTPCMMPNYVSHLAPANLLKKTILAILRRETEHAEIEPEKIVTKISGIPVDGSPNAE
jgi:hypothetical protein